VPSAAFGVEHVPPEQVPAALHCAVGGGQTTPAQGSQHAAHPAAAQPSVHSSAQEPSPQHSSGEGEARASAARAMKMRARRAAARAPLAIAMVEGIAPIGS
jgi:hypothetical protein